MGIDLRTGASTPPLNFEMLYDVRNWVRRNVFQASEVDLRTGSRVTLFSGSRMDFRDRYAYFREELCASRRLSMAPESRYELLRWDRRGKRFENLGPLAILGSSASGNALLVEDQGTRELWLVRA